MAGECEWLGFVSQACSGVREALFAAGVDCAAPSAWQEPTDFSEPAQGRGHGGD